MDTDSPFLRLLQVKSTKPIKVDTISFVEWKPAMEPLLLDQLRSVLPSYFQPDTGYQPQL
jgi:hypothetical protein